MRIKFHVGIVIRVVRRSFQLEQDELASRANVSISTVQNIESGGDFKFSNLEKIAVALNTNAKDLLDRIPDPMELPAIESTNGKTNGTPRKRKQSKR